ncbi:MAG: crossover junction endodeoxyribonuclease RuvC [Actinomycetota bacterium]|nr:crossover junction endodeoxyribonuclease RuvC [Actinomycetota bacterium]
MRSPRNTSPLRVVGLDPGIATTGLAVLERAGSKVSPLVVGVVRTPPGMPQAERLALLRAELAAAFTKWAPRVVSVERLFFNANVKTAMAVGQASGVALATAAESGAEVVTYTPLEVKQTVVGVGRADKKQVATMVASILGLAAPPSPPDAADACALALCYLNRSSLVDAVQAVAR